MSERRPFREIKLQWLQLLSRDGELSDCAKCVALYIVTAHLNGHTEKAWPSYQTIADATGKSVKTIQRAVNDLEARGWFAVSCGNGVGHNTEYRPSASSILRATEAREKTDKIVTLYPREGSQGCPERRTKLTGEGGQICPPNLENKINYEPNAHARSEPCPPIRQVFPKVFLAATNRQQVAEWQAWLCRRGLPCLEALGLAEIRNGRAGFHLPSYWPPGDERPDANDWAAFLSRRHLPFPIGDVAELSALSNRDHRA